MLVRADAVKPIEANQNQKLKGLEGLCAGILNSILRLRSKGRYNSNLISPMLDNDQQLKLMKPNRTSEDQRIQRSLKACILVSPTPSFGFVVWGVTTTALTPP